MNPFGTYTGVQVTSPASWAEKHPREGQVGSTRGGDATETLVQFDDGSAAERVANEALRPL